MAKDWSREEVEFAVADYFTMLQMELKGEKYNKTENRRALIKKLDNRGQGSVEFKHQNISAVLLEMGIPYIDGYKPLGNYQRVLAVVVSEFLQANLFLQNSFRNDTILVPAIPTVEDILSVLENPPARNAERSAQVSESPAIYNPAGVDYLELEAQNLSLGDAGEMFVLNYERARLIHAGRESLADRIEQVSVTEGPAAGFDIRSFEVDGADRFIEAKTTKYGKSTPFYVTPNELKCSEDRAGQYYLYRIFRFRSEPRLFLLEGSLKDTCILKPSQYSAKAAMAPN